MTQMLIAAPRVAPGAWSLLLVANREIAGQTRRISLVGDDLDGFVHQSGQRARLILQTPTGVVGRDFPIRGFDADELRLDLDVCVADDPAMACWARSAGIGDAVIAELIVPEGPPGFQSPRR
jgi:NADPH-dependent ferric siderophore reductase